MAELIPVPRYRAWLMLDCGHVYALNRKGTRAWASSGLGHSARPCMKCRAAGGQIFHHIAILCDPSWERPWTA